MELEVATPPRAEKRYVHNAGASITINPVAIARDENRPKKSAKINALRGKFWLSVDFI